MSVKCGTWHQDPSSRTTLPFVAASFSIPYLPFLQVIMASWDVKNAHCSGFLDIPAPKQDQMFVTQMNEKQTWHAAINIDKQQILVMGGKDKCWNDFKTTEIYVSWTKMWEKGPDLNER